MTEGLIGAIAHYLNIEPKVVFLLLVVFAFTAIIMGLMVLYVLKRPTRVFSKNNINQNAKALLAKEGWKIPTCEDEMRIIEILNGYSQKEKEDFYKRAKKVRLKAGIPTGIIIAPYTDTL